MLDQENLLIYVSHSNKFMRTLSHAVIQVFLYCYGYVSYDVPYLLYRLKERLNESQFSHEIGMFLGYSLCHVKVFIHNKRTIQNDRILERI